MKIVNDSYEILTDLSNPISILKNIESIARTCYKSEDKITDDSCIRFCKMLVDRDTDTTVPIYIGNELIDEYILNKNSRTVLRSGGRA